MIPRIDRTLSSPNSVPRRDAPGSSVSFAALQAQASASLASVAPGGGGASTPGGSSGGSPATTPDTARTRAGVTPPAATPSRVAVTARDGRVPTGELWKPVNGTTDLAEIVSGPRTGLWVNLSGNARDGMAFSIESRDGVRVHVYEQARVDVAPVDAAAVDVLDGARGGRFRNLSENARHGQELQVIQRDGALYHVYGACDDVRDVEVRDRPVAPEAVS